MVTRVAVNVENINPFVMPSFDENTELERRRTKVGLSKISRLLP